MKAFIITVIAQSLDPIKIISILLIMHFITKRTVIFVFIISGVLLGGAGIWLLKKQIINIEINIFTYMLASILSALLIFSVFSLLKTSYIYIGKLKSKE